MREEWTSLSDERLLAQCEVDTYRASGPGGQKRNKTSSAVRIRHPASELLVIAEESRSQHENRAKALKRLRQAFFLKLREPATEDVSTFRAVVGEDGRVDVGRKDPRFWPAVGLALDVLEAVEARVSDAAERFQVSTAQLVDFFRIDPKVWEQAQYVRAKFGQKALK